ncbi:MAG TPA: hypothetical protein VMS54_07790 [Vicinamibacterales bacterium]|nr:hypothetical protein [Vicinamibacterales bacterium]
MPTLSRARVVVIAFAFAGVACAPYWLQLPAFGAMQRNDYYWILGQITTGDGWTSSVAAWATVRSNEHWVPLPALVYAINVVLTGGDNRGLSAAVLLILLLTFALILRTTVVTLDPPASVTIAMTAVIAAFVFTTATAHNVVMGFSGVIWGLSNLLAVTAIAALTWWPRAFAPALIAALVGAASYSTNLMVWPALVTGALVMCRRRQAAAFAIIGSAVMVVSAAFYKRSTGHPVPETQDLAGLVAYVPAYLGAPFSASIGVATALGAAAILLAAFALIGAMRLPLSAPLRRQIAPGLMLQGYAASNALAAAVFRYDFGGPIQPRYAMVALLFWVGMVMVAGAVWCTRVHGQRGSRPLAVLALTVGAVLVTMTYVRGHAVYADYMDRAVWSPVAAESLRLGILDEDVLKRMTPTPEEIVQTTPAMKRLGHVPFNNADAPLSWPPPPIQTEAAIQGHVDRLTRIDATFVRVEGWAVGSDGGLPEIVFIDQLGAVRGHAMPGLPRGDLRGLGSAAMRSGWAGYARLAPGEWIAAFGRFGPSAPIQSLSGSPLTEAVR